MLLPSMKKTNTWIFIGVGLFVLILPRLVSQYLAYLMLSFFGYGVALLGLNLLFGYTGLLSFGHAMFFTVGAYTVASEEEIARNPRSRSARLRAVEKLR